MTAERNKRAAPDAEHVRRDDFGRPLYRYLLTYSMDGSEWGADVWAYTMEDAEARVQAMRTSLKLEGQVFERFAR